jgi:hypothetical protein
VAEEGSPLNGVVRGPAPGRDHIVLFWLRLPLSQDGMKVDRILCYDTAAAPIEAARQGDERALHPRSAPQRQMWTVRHRAQCA